ncbi:hypothetical protein NMY22_g19602 [Coprinellus aureogranulatus]|nr:hypothetical protein NMY22_g19602 [Coprinellus aureogranulatus]
MLRRDALEALPPIVPALVIHDHPSPGPSSRSISANLRYPTTPIRERTPWHVPGSEPSYGDDPLIPDKLSDFEDYNPLGYAYRQGTPHPVTGLTISNHGEYTIEGGSGRLI